MSNGSNPVNWQAACELAQRETSKARAQLQSSADEIGRLRAERDRLVEALTPSAYTKADYIGRFKFRSQVRADTDQSVPWTAVKEIMAAILDRAALQSLTTPATETEDG